ncbi:MAG: tagatose 1,6-diphosphate aldolase [Anaerolineae bacterium]|nr:tagatose 1,6-diphosphate aldolase [Anaerolineae bacterium]
MEDLFIGKIRGLQAASSGRGVFTILAQDHRGSLRRLINAAAPDSVTGKQLTAWKRRIVRALGKYASAVLLDPEYGAAQCIASGDLPGHVGLVVSLEETGYEGDPLARESRLVEGWSVAKAKRMGASACKLLVHYHPDASNEAQQRALVEEVADACRRYDITLFLEPVSFSIQPGVSKDSDEFARDRRRVVIETAQRLSGLGADVLKMEFPVDPLREKDERVWREACEELTDATQVPWALLSAAVPFDLFERMVTVACEAGASGFIAGRAIWADALRVPEPEVARTLEVAAERLEHLSALADEKSRPWQDRHPLGQTIADQVQEGWHLSYGE